MFLLFNKIKMFLKSLISTFMTSWTFVSFVHKDFLTQLLKVFKSQLYLEKIISCLIQFSSMFMFLSLFSLIMAFLLKYWVAEFHNNVTVLIFCCLFPSTFLLLSILFIKWRHRPSSNCGRIQFYHNSYHFFLNRMSVSDMSKKAFFLYLVDFSVLCPL